MKCLNNKQITYLPRSSGKTSWQNLLYSMQMNRSLEMSAQKVMRDVDKEIMDGLRANIIIHDELDSRITSMYLERKETMRMDEMYHE